jgi:hypothetical protein
VLGHDTRTNPASKFSYPSAFCRNKFFATYLPKHESESGRQILLFFRLAGKSFSRLIAHDRRINQASTSASPLLGERIKVRGLFSLD